jgi:transposase
VRLLRAQGYTVKLIAPQFAKPYIKSNKNDANDAEAMSRPIIRFATVKTVGQQDIHAVHCVRASLVESTTRGGTTAVRLLRDETLSVRFVLSS